MQITTTATVTNVFINGINAFAVEPGKKLTTTWAGIKK